MTKANFNIENGFVETGAGRWLTSRCQPAAFTGKAVRMRRKGWCVRDRSLLDLLETSGVSRFADSSRPFLTHIPCASTIYAVSSKVLVAPASARRGAEIVKAVPMSLKGGICTTEFSQGPEGEASQEAAWAVMATAGRTCRIPLEEGETLSVRPEAIVAWTGKRPTGFCPKLSLWDVILPRGPRDLLFTFYGPGVVWVEGSKAQSRRPNAARRAYVV